MKLGKLFQQGDIVVESITNIPKSIKKLSHLTLARGEKTFHHHTITKGEAELYKHEGKLYLKVLSDEAELTHQEHNTIVLPKGNFVVRPVREFDWVGEEVRNVQD